MFFGISKKDLVLAARQSDHQIIQYRMDGSYITRDDIKSGNFDPKDLSEVNKIAFGVKS